MKMFVAAFGVVAASLPSARAADNPTWTLVDPNPNRCEVVINGGAAALTYSFDPWWTLLDPTIEGKVFGQGPQDPRRRVHGQIASLNEQVAAPSILTTAGVNAGGKAKFDLVLGGCNVYSEHWNQFVGSVFPLYPFPIYWVCGMMWCSTHSPGYGPPLAVEHHDANQATANLATLEVTAPAEWDAFQKAAFDATATGIADYEFDATGEADLYLNGPGVIINAPPPFNDGPCTERDRCIDVNESGGIFVSYIDADTGNWVGRQLPNKDRFIAQVDELTIGTRVVVWCQTSPRGRWGTADVIGTPARLPMKSFCKVDVYVLP